MTEWKIPKMPEKKYTLSVIGQRGVEVSVALSESQADKVDDRLILSLAAEALSARGAGSGGRYRFSNGEHVDWSFSSSTIPAVGLWTAPITGLESAGIDMSKVKIFAGAEGNMNANGSSGCHHPSGGASHPTATAMSDQLLKWSDDFAKHQMATGNRDVGKIIAMAILAHKDQSI